MLDGSVTCESELCNWTPTPPLGAGALRVIVPVTSWPPFTLFALKVTAETQIGGFTVNATCAKPHPVKVAVICACAEIGVVNVVTLKPADVCPAGIRTPEPGEAIGLL